MSGDPFRYVLSDVFTDRPFGGNSLAVFPDAEGVPEALMPVIARELNLSETVFVLPPNDPSHAARLRIFTPGSELPFAGHPTVGTACVLAAEGKVAPDDDFVLELVAGTVPAQVRGKGRVYHGRFDAPRLPEMEPGAPPPERLASALSLEPGDLEVDGWSPEIWSCGVPFLMAPVRDRDALRRARVDMAAWERWIAESTARGVYLVTPDAEEAGSAVRARMYAPTLGIPEDPATGSAASAFAGFLARRAPKTVGSTAWRIEQGFEMGRPSHIEIEVMWTSGSVSRVRVGGGCVMMGEGRLHSS